MARYLALTCEALARPVYAAAAVSPHTVNVRLFKQGLHNRPKGLRVTLQDEIDAVPEGEWDAILLAYGMCGTATVGLASRHTPLVLPRAHDCITLYLGSRQRYNDEFMRHPGTYWYSVDYMERQEKGAAVALGAAGLADDEEQYEQYVQKYGQETADMLMEEIRSWSRHYTRATFIDLELNDGGIYAERAQEKAAKEGWVFERMQGDTRLMRMLMHGEWDPEEFLVVPPGKAIGQSYKDDIVKAVGG
ncbi:MAG: DUF1638 domain-containing protein, partial [Caldilineaceae bacterium]